jgi:hypothetical protein
LRALALLALCACGTYTHVRGADNLPRGGVELAAGLAANQLGEVLPVLAGAVGITDRLELEAQYEIYSALAEVRFAILSSERDGLALALGVGGGAATVLVVEEEGDSDAAALLDVVVGRRWDRLELYLSEKAIWMVSKGYVINALRAGVRWRAGQAIFGAEGGASIHHDFLALAEASLFFALSL